MMTCAAVAAPHVPVVGTSYSVVCPVCCTDVIFVCATVTQFAVRCSACHTRIDLRRPTCVLPEMNTATYDDDKDDGGDDKGSSACVDEDGAVVAVRYAAEVVPSSGSTATAQVAVVVAKAQRDAERTLPKMMTQETRQAYVAKRFQAFSSRLSVLHVFTYVIELVVFGTRPAARLGNVRIFRKRLPLLGTRYIVVTRTTTSYALPCLYTALTMTTLLWLHARVAAAWWQPWLRLEWALFAAFYVLLFHVVYSDPGFIAPGYLDSPAHRSNTATTATSATTTATAPAAGRELTLLEIEKNVRESLYENVRGELVERKWCSTCEMHRPVRAAHCYFCGLCCHDHDHHCTVIGVCVGRRKIELFTLLAFVGAATYVLPMLLIAPAWVTHSEALTGLTFVVSLVLFGSCLVVGAAMSFMTRQLLTNMLTAQTTRERTSGVYASKRNPFSRGTLGNLCYHLCTRRVEPSIFTDEFVAKCAANDTKRDLGGGFTDVCL